LILRPTQDRGRHAATLIILDLIISFVVRVGVMQRILARLPVLEELMMNALRVVSAMPMFLVPMAVSRLRMLTPLLVNSLSTVVLVKKMQRSHAGNLVETMMIVVLVRLVIQV
jgi:hypothetical protein